MERGSRGNGSDDRALRLRRRAAGILLAATPWLIPSLALASDVTLPDRNAYSEEGARACIDCHDTPKVMGIVDTVHASREDPNTPASQKQCQSCHGPSAAHMKFPRQVANVHFGKASRAPARVQNEMCIDCHGTPEARKNWEASAHGIENVLCSTCHSLHDPDAIVPARAAVNASCTGSCHTDLMQGRAVEEFSHAAGRKLDGRGEMTCTSCHSPHGPLSSASCSDCHPQTDETRAAESPKARRFHEVSARRGVECIRCHQGIAHPISALARQDRDAARRAIEP